MQKGMLLDQGSAFESSMHERNSENEVNVSKCIYNDVLTDEGKPHLLSVCCCSQDAHWCVSAILALLMYTRTTSTCACVLCCVLGTPETAALKLDNGKVCSWACYTAGSMACKCMVSIIIG